MHVCIGFSLACRTLTCELLDLQPAILDPEITKAWLGRNDANFGGKKTIASESMYLLLPLLFSTTLKSREQKMKQAVSQHRLCLAGLGLYWYLGYPRLERKFVAKEPASLRGQPNHTSHTYTDGFWSLYERVFARTRGSHSPLVLWNSMVV